MFSLSREGGSVAALDCPEIAPAQATKPESESPAPIFFLPPHAPASASPLVSSPEKEWEWRWGHSLRSRRSEPLPLFTCGESASHGEDPAASPAQQHHSNPLSMSGLSTRARGGEGSGGRFTHRAASALSAAMLGMRYTFGCGFYWLPLPALARFLS